MRPRPQPRKEPPLIAAHVVFLQGGPDRNRLRGVASLKPLGLCACNWRQAQVRQIVRATYLLESATCRCDRLLLIMAVTAVARASCAVYNPTVFSPDRL